MALSPYRESNSSVSRSRRSSSFSQTSRKFLFQEVFAVCGNALFRSYSCGQVSVQDQNGQTVQSTQVRVLHMISPAKTFIKTEMGINQKSFSDSKELLVKWAKRKPVKAKMSLQFSDGYQVNESTANIEKSTSDKIISFQRRWNMKRIFYVNLFILTILSAYHIHRFTYCNQQWDTLATVHNMRESVFGQEVVISKIEAVLTNFNKSSESVVMSFTGSGGVGKTFISSIIYESFPWESNKYIYFFDTNTEEILRTKKYSSCGVNLIVIDDISAFSAEQVFQDVKYLIDRNDIAKFLVILIFTAHGKDTEKFLLLNAKNEDRRFHYIPFRDLEEQDITNCINAELERQKKHISQDKLNKLLIENMKFCNISNSFLGCKTVYHEVSSLPGNE